MNSVKKYVVSRTLDELSGIIRYTVVTETCEQAIRNLKEQKGPRYPGARQQQSDSNADLNTILSMNSGSWIFPSRSGTGKKRFSATEHNQPVSRLIDSKISTTGVIIATYEPAGELKTGSFALDNPSVAEIERRKRLADEGKA